MGKTEKELIVEAGKSELKHVCVYYRETRRYKAAEKLVAAGKMTKGYSYYDVIRTKRSHTSDYFTYYTLTEK